MKIKNFNQFINEVNKEIGKIEKDVEIRFDIESSQHVWKDRKFRHEDDIIEDHEILDLIENSMEQITIDLMRNQIKIDKRFVIKNSELSLACVVHPDENNFDLHVITCFKNQYADDPLVGLRMPSGQYVYDVDKKQAFRYNPRTKTLVDIADWSYQQKLINLTDKWPTNELNHQMPGAPLGVNKPGYGQGAHLGNWGPNYGNSGQGVRGTFGNKGDKLDPNLPFKKKQQSFASVVLDPTTGEYIHEDDIQGLLNDYNVRCRQNSEEPQEFDRIDAKTIEYIQNYLK